MISWNDEVLSRCDITSSEAANRWCSIVQRFCHLQQQQQRQAADCRLCNWHVNSWYVVIKQPVRHKCHAWPWVYEYRHETLVTSGGIFRLSCTQACRQFDIRTCTWHDVVIVSVQETSSAVSTSSIYSRYYNDFEMKNGRTRSSFSHGDYQKSIKFDISMCSNAAWQYRSASSNFINFQERGIWAGFTRQKWTIKSTFIDPQ